jgi:16S rRNA (cytosine1402-N4)-methyltransferase
LPSPMNPSEVPHYPVLYREVIGHLPESCETFFDGTLGHGGHAKEILSKRKDLELYFAVDQDPEVVRRFESDPIDPRVVLIQGNFSEVLSQREKHFGEKRLDVVFLDLGTSQYQLKNPSRGFSFLHDGPLDMRMNPGEGIPLSSWISQAEIEEISGVLRDFGEEKFHFRIARAIVENRERITTTLDLAKVIENCLPKSYLRKSPIHGATRSFQAFRIFLNRELESLETALDNAIEALRPGGRILVISFHSLEDRIVKRRFQDWESELGVPDELRHIFKDARKARGKRNPRKPIRPSMEEISENDASRSARLRVFVRGSDAAN